MTPFLRRTPYDPEKDFAPVTLVVTSPNILVVHPSLPGTVMGMGCTPGQVYEDNDLT